MIEDLNKDRGRSSILSVCKSDNFIQGAAGDEKQQKAEEEAKQYDVHSQSDIFDMNKFDQSSVKKKELRKQKEHQRKSRVKDPSALSISGFNNKLQYQLNVCPVNFSQRSRSKSNHDRSSRKSYRSNPN